MTVARGVIETVVSGSGNLEPARQAELDFATSGRITKIYTAEGEHVSKGELLARIDDRSARVALAKAQADLVDAQDALATASEAADTEVVALQESTTSLPDRRERSTLPIRPGTTLSITSISTVASVSQGGVLPWQRVRIRAMFNPAGNVPPGTLHDGEAFQSQ